jgi:hypothetical protein
MASDPVHEPVRVRIKTTDGEVLHQGTRRLHEHERVLHVTRGVFSDEEMERRAFLDYQRWRFGVDRG